MPEPMAESISSEMAEWSAQFATSVPASPQVVPYAADTAAVSPTETPEQSSDEGTNGGCTETKAQESNELVREDAAADEVFWEYFRASLGAAFDACPPNAEYLDEWRFNQLYCPEEAPP